ncbi:MAG: cadherin-like beta sandwich domain-containing protein [Bacilli bacterium]|nr:cadherin-like beta sandwich domain-containing protein [Bacilli bacterium]
MKRIYKYLFIIVFLISSFLFINNVKADYEATVLNPVGASCEKYTGSSAGKCLYSNSSLENYVSRVIWLDTGDKVTVIESKDTVKTQNKDICSDYYVYVSYYFPKVGETFYGYYCNANLINPNSALTDQMKTEFKNAGFPESYWEALAVTKTAHPNWTFNAIQTNLDWNDVISAESSVGTSLIQGDEGYRSTLGGSYDYYTDTFTVLEGSSWYAASKGTVAYYMDPRNFLNDMYIFQFESLETNPDIQTLDGVKTVLEDNYLEKYSEDFITAAKESGVSSVYLAALAYQEVGGGSVATKGEGFTYSIYNTKYSSLQGKWIDGGFYNVYNIGAGTDKSPAQNSVVYAMGGADGTETDFDRPWDNMSKAIIGGAKFIGDKFINKGQYSIYLKKFNVVSTYWDIYSHQYQTNIKAAADEANSVYRSYNELDVLGSDFIFSIPVYENMPEKVVTLPNKGNPNNYLNSLKVDNKIVEGFDGSKTSYTVHVANDQTKVNIVATTVNSNATVSNTGEKKLNVGDNKFKIKVTAQNGSKKTYTLNIVRSENTSGEPLVDELVSESGVKSDGTYFSGFEIDTNSSTLVEKIKSLNANAKVEIKDSNGTIKKNKSLATGDKVSITSAGETKSYTVVIYGDTSGDGKINPLDLLRVQKHILDVTELNGAYKKAADTSKDGKINPLDLLKIQKYILEVGSIEQ